MTEPDQLMNRREILVFKLDELRRRHRTLDDMIVEMEERPEMRDSLDLRRLKKDKLALKDQIVKIEDALTPDIIA
ncbi:MAG: YdcH family protein [Pseudomonadota bacterium]